MTPDTALGAMPSPGACAALGTLALTKDGSKKRVNGTGKLTKMAHTNASWEGPDRQSHRKFPAEHLN